MTFIKATILPNIDPATITGPIQQGYVYEKDANGNVTAIIITGEIEDTNWKRLATCRIEGAQLAGLPAATNTPDQPTDPRYQAIMGIVAAFVKDQWTTMDAQWQALHRPVIEVRAPSEVAALPTLTSLPN